MNVRSDYVFGTSAVKPDCSRYRNENEYIASPRNRSAAQAGIHHDPVNRTILDRSVSLADHAMGWLFRSFGGNTSEAIRIEGRPFRRSSRLKVVPTCIGYAIVAVALIYFGAC